MKQTLDSLPVRLYSAQTSRDIDALAIEKYNMPGYSLMSQAGKAVFDRLQQTWPLARRILVCCGAGNNAGDGYLVARLAQQAGLHVDVISMVDPENLQGDALRAYEDWKALGIQPRHFETELLDKQDLVVDALLGTGLQRDVEGEWYALIEAINNHPVPVIAVDIPSGLHGDTGTVMGIAMQADITVCFIALKRGMLTHQARDYCGELFFADLGVPADVYDRIAADARLLQWPSLKPLLSPRRHDTHKGSYGHVLVVGGDHGMPGAVRMAGEAALRSGAGRVSVATRPEHVDAVVGARPELMVWGVDAAIPESLISSADCIVIGPGLGRHSWGNRLLGQVLEWQGPRVVDADALNLITSEDGPRDDWVLTPHPGEAAHLLGETTADIQRDRYQAAQRLQSAYGGSIVLKGSGSILQAPGALPAVCAYGNPGMASAGMGDVLSGVIGGLMAQGFEVAAAAQLGMVVHARAGDLAAENGQRGLLASDLYPFVHSLLNPEGSLASDS